MEGTTLIISPLLSLQADQSKDLIKRGIKAACLNGATGKKETKAIVDSLKDGSLKLLYVAPETLLRENEYDEPWFLNFLQVETNINHIVLDEAHSVLQSSQDFRPKYRQLDVLKEYYPDIPFTCLTGTASEEDIKEITSLLKITDYSTIIHSLYRPNLHQHVVRKIDELYQLMGILRKYPKGTSGLIYCNTKDKCSAISDYLNRNGFNTACFYSTISKKEKNRVLEGFLDKSIDIVVSTTAFGTGINHSSVRFVINLDCPSSMNDMVQQIGRAGRDGNISEVHTFYHPSDITKLKYILRMSITSPIRLKKAYDVLDDVIKFSINSKQCRNKLILQHYGQSLDEDCGTCDNCKKNL